MANDDDVDVLLVEDNLQDAEMTIRALRKRSAPHHLHHVVDGAEALAFLFATGAYLERSTKKLPKVVLLDLKLPKVDGLEVLRRIKADERTRMVPVVMLTSSREERDVVESYRLGTNSYVAKPIEFDKFVDAVAHLGVYWMSLNLR